MPNRVKSKVIGLGAVSILVVAGLAGCGAKASTSSALATVNGQTITNTTWKNAVAGTDLLQGASLPTSKSAKKTQVKQLAQELAAQQWALKNHVVTQKKASQEATQFINQNVVQALGGTKKLQATLKKDGITKSGLQSFMTEQMILQAAFAKKTASIKSLPKGTASKFYKSHTSLFVTPKQVEVRSILVKTQSLAKSLVTQLKAGANFKTLADKNSIDPSVKKNHGELGWTSTGSQSGYVKEFYQEMDKLKVGQWGIAHSQYGWHVLQVQATKPPATQSYKTVKSEIVQNLLQSKQQAAFQSFAQGLLKKAKVSYHD